MKLYLWLGQYDPKIVKLDVHNLISAGGKSGAFIFSGFETKWFEIDPDRDKWAHNPLLLIGQKAQVEATGVIAKYGHVDIVITLFDKYNQGDEIVNQCCVGVVGGMQFSEFRVMGMIKRSEV